MTPTTSVVVTTYERPDALRAVLVGLSRQHDRDFEVVVADDGSGPDTAAVVEDARNAAFSDRIRHVRQADEGFRAARARNLAVQASRGSRLVFLDGDCIPRPGFVGSHRSVRPGVATCGRRSLLTQSATEQWLRRPEEPPTPGVLGQIGMCVRGEMNRPPAVVDLLLTPLVRPLSWRRFRGMNHGVHRSDYLEVDGYDQSFTGWGFEDSDLAIRLQSAGIRLVRPGRGSTVVHLWHPEEDRRFEGRNLAKLDSVRSSGRTRAIEGISALPSESP